MHWAELGQRIIMTIYTFALVMVSIYGIHRYVLVYLYYRHRRKAHRSPPNRIICGRQTSAGSCGRPWRAYRVYTSSANVRTSRMSDTE